MKLFNFLYRKNFGLNPSSLASCKQTKKEKLKNFRVVQESIHVKYNSNQFITNINSNYSYLLLTDWA